MLDGLLSLIKHKSLTLRFFNLAISLLISPSILLAQDHYSILGVSQESTKEEIRRTFYRLAKAYHPDLNPGDIEKEEHLKKITVAYEVLSDPEKRRNYDQTLSINRFPRPNNFDGMSGESQAFYQRYNLVYPQTPTILSNAIVEHFKNAVLGSQRFFSQPDLLIDLALETMDIVINRNLSSSLPAQFGLTLDDIWSRSTARLPENEEGVMMESALFKAAFLILHREGRSGRLPNRYYETYFSAGTRAIQNRLWGIPKGSYLNSLNEVLHFAEQYRYQDWVSKKASTTKTPFSCKTLFQI